MDTLNTISELIHTDDAKRLKTLLNDKFKNTPINYNPSHKYTLLFLAVLDTSIECARVIIEHEMNLNALDINKVNHTYDDENRTALHEACIQFKVCGTNESKLKNCQMIRFFVECGADPNIHSNHFNSTISTPLMAVCSFQAFKSDRFPDDTMELIQVLINYGANRDFVNWNGRTAEVVARDNCDDEIADTVRDCEPDLPDKGVHE